MYWDMGREVEAIRRRMVRCTRIAVFLGAAMTHLLASVSLLMWQTSCFYPRCASGTGFDVFRGLMRVPLFATPWLDLPSPDADFVRDGALFGLLIANATTAVALYWGLTVAVRRCLERINRSRASSAYSEGRGK